MTRKDFNITAVADSGGALRITVNTNLTTLTAAQGSPVLVGATMWVVSDNGTYNRLYTVVSVTNVANSVVTFGAGTYVSAATTGFINLSQRTGYYVSLGLYNAADVLLHTLRYSPDRQGLLLMDVSGILINLISPDNVADYVAGFTINNETTAYLRFYIRHTEVWKLSAESEVNDTSNRFYAVFGAKQIGELYGGNLAEFTGLEFASPRNKFLTRFSRPKIWRGYPFSISLIVDTIATDTGVYLQYYDAANSVVSENLATIVFANNNDRLIRININSVLAIPSDAVRVALHFVNTDPTNIPAPLDCDIVDACPNPILLWWRNSLGGDAFWLFDYNQQYSYRYNNGRKAKRYVLFAQNLTDNEYDSISELSTLGEVYEPSITELTTAINKSQERVGAQVYMMDATGKKIGVIVIPTEFSTMTKLSRNKLQIVIELPEIY